MNGIPDNQMLEFVQDAKVLSGIEKGKIKLIKLSQGVEALVNKEDYDLLSRYKWSACNNKYGGFNAKRNTYDGKHSTVMMHREIMGLKNGDPLVVDHINHNPLDNRRCNLRVVTQRTNNRNRRLLFSTNTSGYRGVWFNKRSKKWEAGINIYLGKFDSPEEAARAYDKAAVRYRGAEGIMNFVDEI